MNILQCISSRGFFGAESIVMQLASELQKNGFCNPVVGVFENLQSPHLEVANICRKNGIETAVFPCRGKFDLKTIIQLRGFIRDCKIDIIHSHGYKSNLYSFFASRGLSTRLVATCHNWLGDDFKMRFYAALDRFFLRRFDRVVAVSDDVRNRITGSGVSPGNVTIVKNGICLDRFDRVYSVAKIKTQLGIPQDDKVIGTVGRISPEKGHKYLLGVADSIVEECPGTVFLIIGDGPLREELQREYDSPFIIFTGIRNDVPELYQCMDIFVLPSLTEGLPVALLEAMASNLPVVATRVGGVPSVISNNQTGLLIEPRDEEAIKESLLHLLRNPKEAEEMGKEGCQRVKEHYSSQKMTSDYLNIYRELIKNDSSPSKRTEA
jgi:glycosyltransferase involved in cell wall biosynthesis